MHDLGGGDFIWQAYDPAVKADLFSTGLATPAGVYLVDPIPLAQSLLTTALRGGAVAGVVVTNENHFRSAQAVAKSTAAPIVMHPEALAKFEHGSGIFLMESHQISAELRRV